MKNQIFCTLLVIILSYQAQAARLKIIQKRQICSDGNCSPCDGTTCNTCNNNVCCSSVNCNRCVSQCSRNCNTVACNNNCVSGCVNSCQNLNCQTSRCSQCINSCSSNCDSSQCTNQCTKSCDCKESDSNTSVVLVPSESAPFSVNNSNNNNVNLTTQVNINNVVHNINNISIPVYVNTTNINNIDIAERRDGIISGGYTNSNGSVIPMPIPIPIPIPQVVQPPSYNDNCCTLLHPRTCYTDSRGADKCYIRRSRECSSACTSPVISIVEEGSTTNCEKVSSWPYLYCGNYVRKDCNDCYSCGSGYSTSECFQQSGCSETCRIAAPSCVRSQSGLRCL